MVAKEDKSSYHDLKRRRHTGIGTGDISSYQRVFISSFTRFIRVFSRHFLHSMQPPEHHLWCVCILYARQVAMMEVITIPIMKHNKEPKIETISKLIINICLH